MCLRSKSRIVKSEKQPLLGNDCVTLKNGVTVRSGVFYTVHADSYICNNNETVAAGVFCGVHAEAI
jgi:hypothetical protein